VPLEGEGVGGWGGEEIGKITEQTFNLISLCLPLKIVKVTDLIVTSQRFDTAQSKICFPEVSEERLASIFKVSETDCLLTLSPARCKSPKDNHLSNTCCVSLKTYVIKVNVADGTCGLL
jgi:hypothetical protein